MNKKVTKTMESCRKALTGDSAVEFPTAYVADKEFQSISRLNLWFVFLS